MAQRKSSVMVEARERARKAAAGPMAREDRLLKLGERFFVAVGDQEQIWDAAEKKIHELRAKAEADTLPARGVQREIIVAMKAEKLSSAEIAQRLGLTAAEVRAALDENKQAPAGTTPKVVEDGHSLVAGDTVEPTSGT